MEPLMRRRWTVIYFFLYALILLSWAEHQSPEGPDGSQGKHVSGVSKSNSRKKLHWHAGNNDNQSQGDLWLQEALSVLQSIETPQSRLAQLDKGSGVVGTTVYYAKEAFILLFMNSPKEKDYLAPEPEERKLSKPLAKAVQLLEAAEREDNLDAIFLLAEINFYGNFTHPRNYMEAFRRYRELSFLTGNSTAQYMVGFMYATGIGEAVERDQAKALLYHTFAARAGNTRSEMTVAFRHHTGIGAPRNCDKAAWYYKRVADKAIAYSRSGPPGGVAIQRDSYRLADEEGGVYGEGASVVSSGMNANRAPPNSDQHAALDDVLEYLDLLSRKGDLKATFSLGRLHYDGSRTMKRNLKKARAYFVLVARKYWAKDGTILSDDRNGMGKIAAKAAGYLGRMFLRGEGTEQSFEKAIIWYTRGIANGDAPCQYELGLMHLNGWGLQKNPILAANYFKAAAEQDWAPAQNQLGKLFLDQGDVQTAMRFFEMAIRHGHIEAFYHLAEINNNGVGRERSCGLATAYYKVVAEKVEAIHSSFEESNRAYEDGDKETAIVGYMMAAEQGYEYGQANVAFILDEQNSILPLSALLPWKKGTSPLLRNAVLALIYWTRSAKQANIDSMVKMGDYYLRGYGIDKDMEKAAVCYQTAADMQQSAQAMWNLGWMHENGIGVEQDFHLAKRFYDQALETNQEAYLPVKLSLLKLRARSAWNTLTNGKIKSIQPDNTPKKKLSWSEWLSKFLEDDHPYYHSDDPGDDLSDPSSSTLVHDPMPGGDDYYDEIDEGIVESLIIIGLAGALALLVYYRQQRQQNHRRAAAEAAAREQGAVEGAIPGVAVRMQPDGGFFPPPGHPEHAQWVAGGIGH